jgi:hypothetical protein
VRPLNDPAFDYRERVATLDNGSHWFQLWVHDDLGEDVSLVAASAEGKRRDERGRVFGLKERPNGTVDVQELLTVASLPEGNPYVQLEPIAQDPLGNVYLEGRMTEQRLYRATLSWRDDDGSPTGGPTAASLAVSPPIPPQCLVPVPEPEKTDAFLAAIPVLALWRRRFWQRSEILDARTRWECSSLDRVDDGMASTTISNDDVRRLDRIPRT